MTPFIRFVVHACSTRGARLAALALLLAAALSACEKKSVVGEAFPRALPPDATCAVDGMLLMEHPGPKGQALLKDGTVLYYCDTKELFTALHDADQRHRIVRASVQPMDGGDWEAHADGWEEVGALFYVLDAAREGAMGKTIVPFRGDDGAKAFMAEHGGWALPASELSGQIVADYVRSVRESMRTEQSAGTEHSAPAHGKR